MTPRTLCPNQSMASSEEALESSLEGGSGGGGSVQVGPPTWQFALAAYIPLLTANLSVAGSSIILYSIVGHGSESRSNKLRRPHLRLLLVMSCYDIFYSTAKAWTFVLAPAGYGVPFARGNLTTCSFQGFCIQVGAHGTGAYNAILSLYWYCTICRGVPQTTWNKIEPFLHAGVACLFVSLGIAGLSMKLYNPAFAWCFIASFPPGCQSSPEAPPCDRFPPHTLGLYYELFAQLYVQLYFIIVIAANTAIWYKFHQVEKAMTSRLKESCTQQQFSATINDTSQAFCVTPPIPATPAAATTRTTTTTTVVTTRRLSQMAQSVKRERAVAIQSLLFSAAFCLCWIGPTSFHLASWIHGYQEFWAALIIVIFTPMQGLFNALVYGRPTYLRVRQKFPHQSKLWVWKRVFFVDDPMKSDDVDDDEEENEDPQVLPQRNTLPAALVSTTESASNSNSNRPTTTGISDKGGINNRGQNNELVEGENNGD